MFGTPLLIWALVRQEKNFGLDMCLTLGSLVSRLVPLFWVEMFILTPVGKSSFTIWTFKTPK